MIFKCLLGYETQRVKFLGALDQLERRNYESDVILKFLKIVR